MSTNPMDVTELPLFGVSEFTTWPWDFEKDVAAYAALGVDAIEICEFKLDWQDSGRMLEQIDLIRGSGLTISSVQPRLHSLFPDAPRPEPADPAARMALLKDTIRRFAGAGAAEGTVFVSISGAAPGGDFRAAYATAVREYRDLANFASHYGARIALEPLNPILMNVDTFLCSIPEALRVVDEVDHPDFGIFLDVWHIWQTPAVEAQIARCADRIFGVHVNDWHADGAPRSFGDRAAIGGGAIAPLLPNMLRAIREAGYRGAYTLEIFSEAHLPDSLWQGDLETVITGSRAEFEAAWRQARADLAHLPPVETGGN